MKFIMAIIQPHRLENVREALAELGISGMTVTEVKGYGRQGGHTEIYRGTEYAINYTPKIKLEVAVSSDTAPRAVEVIRDAAKQDKIGDGKVFVFSLDEVLRIRTGESGEEAL